MPDKDLAMKLAVEALRTAIVLAVLLVMVRFIEILPFSGLPVLDPRISASDLLAACASAAGIWIFLKAGANAGPVVDALAPWLPGAGTLLLHVMRLSAVLFAYSAFQGLTRPFIGDLEWLYQSVFLAPTLFFLAKAVMHIYAASESVSRAVLSALDPYKRGEERRK